jgi:hypothetical protein
MFIKISAPLYMQSFVKNNTDLEDVDKIEKELAKIDLMFPTDTQAKATNTSFNGRTITVFAFGQILEDQIDKLKNKDIQEVYKSTLFDGINYLKADPEIAQQQLQKDLASLERQMVERENNLIDIDTYMMQLVTGKEGATLNLSHTNAKFIKIAEDDMVKQSDEEIEDYYNELFEDSVGSPDFGTALEHPEETRNELTTKIHHHKFKKK